MVLVLAIGTASCSTAHSWPAWEGFKTAFLSEDGRVIDRSQADLRTVSEGQSYGLFFALVAQDRVAFDAILKWTEKNQCNFRIILSGFDGTFAWFILSQLLIF